jgi:hypothetical protein
MKKIQFTLTFFLLAITISSFGVPQLTFRFANPRILRESVSGVGYDFFEFDVQVKADVAGTYLYSGQAYLTFDNTVFSTTALNYWRYTKGALTSGTNTYDPGSGPDQKYNVILNMSAYGTGYALYIAWTSDNMVFSNGPNPDDFNEITTSYQTLVTVKGRILSNLGTAGIDFVETNMNGQQFYISGPSSYAGYISPCLYTSPDFMSTYTGRLYSGTYGWSQVGGSTNLVQYIDWTTARNTSVWDTAASAATISTVGSESKALALRVHPGARLKVLQGAQLTASGNTDINEERGLWIESTSNGGGGGGSFIDNGTITYSSGASALAERYLAPGQWHAYCIPLQSTYARASYMNIYMKYWDEPTLKYFYVKDFPPQADSLMQAGTGSSRGYFMWNYASSGITRAYAKGSLNTGSVTSIPLTRTLASGGTLYNGYSLVGNPFVSALDLSTGVTWGTDMEQTAWFWNPSGAGVYETYLVAGGGTHSKYCPAQQGFFVHHATQNQTGSTITLNSTGRTHTTTEGFYKDAEPNDLLYLKAENAADPAYFDKATVFFRPEATAGYDGNYDAQHMTGGFASPQLYTEAGEYILTVNAQPWAGVSQVVPLDFTCGTEGNFILSASNFGSFRSGTKVYLEDKKNPGQSNWQDLTINPSYSFAYATGDDAKRFNLHFSNPFFGIDTKSGDLLRIYSNEEYVYISNVTGSLQHGTVMIYNLLGQKVFQNEMQSVLVNKFNPGVLEGYYVVRVTTKDRTYVEKVYIK